MLDGKDATTTATMISHLGHYAPSANIIYNQRYTHTDNVFTCGGFMAGIDGVLGVMTALEGRPATHLLANHLEYNWQPDEGYARHNLPEIWNPLYLDVFPPLFDRDIIRYEGDSSHWDVEYVVRQQPSAESLANNLAEVAAMYEWKTLRNNEMTDF